MPSMVSNSLFPKVRYRYGRMLTDKNYSALVSCKSVAEVIEYLKANTVYKEAFSELSRNSSSLDRKTIENILHKRFFEQTLSICRYGMLSDKAFFNIFVIQADIDQIMRCIRLFLNGNSEMFVQNMPHYLAEYTLIKNIVRLATVRSFEQLLSALEGSPYYEVIKPFESKVKSGDEKGVFHIEAALNDYYIESLKKAYEKLSSANKHDVRDAVAYKLDMDYVCRLYRVKKSWLDTQQEYEDMLRLKLTNFTPKQVKRLVDASDCERLTEELKFTPYRKYFANVKSDADFEKSVEETLCANFKHLVRFSTNADITVYSFIHLLGVELTNLIRITEGIRYKIPPKDIEHLLIGLNAERGGEYS